MILKQSRLTIAAVFVIGWSGSAVLSVATNAQDAPNGGLSLMQPTGEEPNTEPLIENPPANPNAPANEAPNDHEGGDHDGHDHGDGHEHAQASEPTGPSTIRDDPQVIAESLESLPDDVTAEAKAAYDTFMNTKLELVTAMGTLREQHIRFLNDIDRTPTAAKAFREQRIAVAKLIRQHFEEALTVIRYLPSSEAASYLVTMVQHLFELDEYNAATFEASTRLLDLGQRYAYLFLMAARSGIVTGEFEASRKIYEVIDEPMLKDLDRRLIMTMDEMEKQFKREQTLIEQVDAESLPQVELETTKGTITIELFADSAPSAVKHFMTLVEQGFYDGLDFNQVLSGTLALTGDPGNDGRGNSGQFLIDEHENENARPALRGSVVMAKIPIRPGEFVPNSASSQIAFAFLPLPTVASTQTVIGRVVDGMHVISPLRRVDPSKKKSDKEIHYPPDAIITATVTRAGPDLPEPNYVDIRAEFEKAKAAGVLPGQNN